jgi:pSer/pThr/pTyr-binding forkhead associated (FHA) protein
LASLTHSGKTWDLGDTTLIGRASDNDVIVSGYGGVSRQHARIRRAGDTYELEDLGSENGTFISREEAVRVVTGPTTLADGDVIVMSGARLTFSLASNVSDQQTEM